MSGGYFNYEQKHIANILEAVEKLHFESASPPEEAEVVNYYERTAWNLRAALCYIEPLDRCLSGDNSWRDIKQDAKTRHQAAYQEHAEMIRKRKKELAKNYASDLLEALEEAAYMLGITDIDEDSKPYERRIIKVIAKAKGETQ
jgi:hypothetical protein